MPPQYYGFLFGVNIIGMITASYINSRIVIRRGADRLLRIACSLGAAGSLVLLATGISGFGGIAGIALPVFMVLSLLTIVASNAISGALSVVQHRAGAAAALGGRAAIRRRRRCQRGHRLVCRRHAAADDAPSSAPER